jgi:protoheme ferro-lyase
MVFILILVILVLIAGGFYGLFKYKNKRQQPDYYEVYKTQDTVPTGKVGVFVTGLIMTTKLNEAFFYNITKKIFNNIVPWPFRLFATMDNGVALLDPVRYHEHNEFTPTKLEDPFGNDCDMDGEPYIEKYKQGLVKWMPPSNRIYLDHGFFLYKGRKGGIPSLCGKVINKARIWYYDKGILQQKLPHWEESFKVINGAFAKIKEKYKNVECRAATNLIYYDMKKSLHELLDAGCETIVLSALMPIYSHFEEFNSGFRHCFEYIHEWEHAHPGKKIKVIMAPPLGHFKPMRDAFLQMLKDRLDTLPQGADVTVAVTVHGMPWDAFPWEAWLELAPPYRDKIFEEVKALVKTYKFGRTNMVICQDEFADPIWDPNKKYLATNQVYWNAINDGYDYAVGLPLEFLAENSDTLFHHALKNYHGFTDYDVYQPIDYPDWSIPYAREMKQGKTTVIYNGVPVGKYQPYVVDALYQSLDAIIAQKK